MMISVAGSTPNGNARRTASSSDCWSRTSRTSRETSGTSSFSASATAPAPNGKMLMNFGPINQNGGERRLNVAFSRAKKHMALVSSIRHHAITNDYNDGARALKNYLRYAEACSAGDVQSARRVLWEINPAERTAAGTAPTHVVVGQLAAQLRDRGYEVETNVGQSGFRCDLAVRGATNVAIAWASWSIPTATIRMRTLWSATSFAHGCCETLAGMSCWF